MECRFLPTRRLLLCGVATLALPVHASEAPDGRFIAEAFRMRDEAVRAGDQAYGAVVVQDGAILGYGPSRVIADRNSDAHAERVALWAAQKAVGRQRLDGAVIYSSSIPCSACQRALAAAGVARMYYGAAGIEGGAPRG